MALVHVRDREKKGTAWKDETERELLKLCEVLPQFWCELIILLNSLERLTFAQCEVSAFWKLHFQPLN